MPEFATLTVAFGIAGTTLSLVSLGSALKVLHDRAAEVVARPRPKTVTVELTYPDGKHVSVPVPHPEDPEVAHALRELHA